MNLLKTRYRFRPLPSLLGLTLTAVLLPTVGVFADDATASNPYPVVRRAPDQRHFQSEGVEKAIAEFKANVKDPKLDWLFENCFPNTLDTTVTKETVGGKPYTYVITGDIDAMWLRDSSAQVWPYLKFVKQDAALRSLIAGVINKQAQFILKDPYANAFYDDPTRESEWKNDRTDMKLGVHERKWEVDSLCYTIRLAYGYWKATGDTSPFDENWHRAIQTVLKTFKEQQRKDGLGPYHFQRDRRTLINDGFGPTINPVGLICSSFRPSDDPTTYSFLIPSNFFAVVSLRHAAEMVGKISKDKVTAKDLRALANEVQSALKKYAVINDPKVGKVYAYEIDGLGKYSLMDDANVPSLVSLPYLGAVSAKDPIYQNTRKMALSSANPWYFEGKVASGVGGPHVGKDMIWPMAITMEALTSTDDKEIAHCIQVLKTIDAGTGFMHESFNKDDASHYSRSWFAWANTLFGELLWKTYEEKPKLLTSQ
jgi:meiotically up-regulated gene 157 (Mug157) protein